jgi:hypothetical protein
MNSDLIYVNQKSIVHSCSTMIGQFIHVVWPILTNIPRLVLYDNNRIHTPRSLKSYFIYEFLMIEDIYYIIYIISVIKRHVWTNSAVNELARCDLRSQNFLIYCDKITGKKMSIDSAILFQGNMVNCEKNIYNCDKPIRHIQLYT